MSEHDPAPAARGIGTAALGDPRGASGAPAGGGVGGEPGGEVDADIGADHRADIDTDDDTETDFDADHDAASGDSAREDEIDSGAGTFDGDVSVADEDVVGALEAVLLVVDSPVSETALAAAVGRPAAEVRARLLDLAQRLRADRSGIDLRESGGGWRFYTRDLFAPVVERFVLDGTQSRLSRAALETLAVVAYRQPVTRSRIAAVRGVNVDGVVRTLLARGLIEEEGTDSDTGGTLYRTTEMFLERMGLGSLEDLPALGPLLPDVDAIDDE